MPLIFGILAMLLVLLEEYILATYLKFTLMGLSIWVLPVGALILGAAIGAAMSKGFHLSNKRMRGTGVLICALFGAITFVGINFMEYKTTYLLEDGAGGYSQNRTFEGEPISTFSMYEGEEEIQMTFINYVKYNLDKNDMSLNMRGARNVEIKSSGTINYILFIVDFLALIIGAAAGSQAFIPSQFCKECDKYHVEDEIFQASQEDVMDIIKGVNIIIDDPLEVASFVMNHKYTLKETVIYIGILSYCKDCKNGKLIIKKSILKDNKRSDVTNQERVIDIDRRFVELLI